MKTVFGAVSLHLKVRLFQPFSGIAGRNEVSLAVDQGNLGVLLRKLCSTYPAMKDQVYDREGKVWDHLNIFVNQVAVTSDEETTKPLRDGDEIMIMVAVAGG